MATKPVHIRYERDGRYPTGAEFIVKTLADAKRVHPEATVLSYADGTPVPVTPKQPAQRKPEGKGKTGPQSSGPELAAASADGIESVKDGA